MSLRGEGRIHEGPKCVPRHDRLVDDNAVLIECWRGRQLLDHGGVASTLGRKRDSIYAGSPSIEPFSTDTDSSRQRTRQLPARTDANSAMLYLGWRQTWRAPGLAEGALVLLEQLSCLVHSVKANPGLGIADEAFE